VGAINAEVQSLAAVLNAPAEVAGAVTLASASASASANKDTPEDVMVRRHRGSLYVFAAGMGRESTRATFTVAEGKEGSVEVIGEGRTVSMSGGKFEDGFEGYGVHLYRMTGK